MDTPVNNANQTFYNPFFPHGIIVKLGPVHRHPPLSEIQFEPQCAADDVSEDMNQQRLKQSIQPYLGSGVKSDTNFDLKHPNHTVDLKSIETSTALTDAVDPHDHLNALHHDDGVSDLTDSTTHYQKTLSDINESVTHLTKSLSLLTPEGSRTSPPELSYSPGSSSAIKAKA